MARFAVDQREQGKGYGRSLFRDALIRSLNGAETIGGRAFLVHAKDEQARLLSEVWYGRVSYQFLPLVSSI